jgi:hypothetical protein
MLQIIALYSKEVQLCISKFPQPLLLPGQHYSYSYETSVHMNSCELVALGHYEIAMHIPYTAH